MSVPSIRLIPGVTNVYAIRFRNEGAEHIIVRHFGRTTWTYKEVGNSFDRCSSLDDYLVRYRRAYLRRYPLTEFFDSPVVVLSPPTEAPEDYTIAQLAEGVLVAYSSSFVAGFSKRYERWFIYGLALEPNRYINVDAQSNFKLGGELWWDGSGIRFVQLVSLDSNDAMPTWAVDLLPARMVYRQAQIRRLYVEGTRIFASTRSHTFLLHRDGKWRLFPSPPAGDRNCHFLNRDCTLEGARRIIVRMPVEGERPESSDSDASSAKTEGYDSDSDPELVVDQFA